MRALRFVAAFLVAPGVAVAGYAAYFTALWSSRGVETPSALTFVAALSPAVYAASVILWLPFVLLLRRLGEERLLPLLVGGMVLGALLGIAALGTGGGEIFSAAATHFLAVALLLGLLFGALFWAIALAGRSMGTKPKP